MTAPTEISDLDLIVAKAQKAQRIYEANGSQKLFDLACQAVAWALMKPENNKVLSKLAVEETGLGNTQDKIQKNHNKTLGLLRDLKGIKAFGHIADEPELGLSTYLRPKGVIAAIVPSTNPLATPVNNIINALKTGNSIVVAPSPKGAGALNKLLAIIHENLEKIGLDKDLVQMVPIPPSKAKTQHLMELADLLVVTGSPNNVRAGYSSGTPALGVGQGNVVTIIDETADLKQAAAKISASKTFDNATSCSSENSVVILREVYEDAVRAFEQEGGLLLNKTESDHLVATHWYEGKITRALLAQDIEVIIENLGLQERGNNTTKFLMVPTNQAGPEAILSGEKMSRFFALYVAENFDEAVEIALKIQNYQGAGHSLGLHSNDDKRAHHLAMVAQTCRIIVNQAHCFATGGFFNNGLPFSLSMGCGSWGGNSIDDNLNWTHFVNKVKIVRVIEDNRPELEDVLSEFWDRQDI